ncbi:uncharacterized protein LOC110037115, partial [Phalaenopsis equestris]|uniref:uncharacterized protein LOC110037115 n=1 Tax=Phalaenopsis equestris TaxID=78828 RepID=UPI0009E1A73D
MRTVIRMASIFPHIGTHRIPQLRRGFSCFADASSKDTPQPFNECDEFMTWLRKKTGLEISSVLSIGNSRYGRSLFASEPIEDGDCILKIPYTVHLTPDKIIPEVESLIVDDVGTISRLAVVLLAEQKL